MKISCVQQENAIQCSAAAGCSHQKANASQGKHSQHSMGCGASADASVQESPQRAPCMLVHAQPASTRHRATNWSHAVHGGPGHGSNSISMTVDGGGVQLLAQPQGSMSGWVTVAQLDLYTIQSWRATPGQLLLKLTDQQVVSFDMDDGGYAVVGELERVCHAMATQQPMVAAPVSVVGVASAAAAVPAPAAPTESIDTSDMERGIAGCVTRLQEQMALRWLAVAAEVARLRAAAEATAASAEMLDRMSAEASAEGGDSVTLDARAGGATGEQSDDEYAEPEAEQSAAAREGRICSACTFENEEVGESCTMCGGTLAPVVVTIPVGATAGSSAAAAAALAAAAEVVAEAVEAEDVSWLTGDFTFKQ